MTSAPAGIAIRSSRLTKRYEIYNRPIDVLLEVFTARRLGREFAALQEVSFETQRGEVLGIVGRNGAGKSTLLKVIAGTLSPTEGKVEVNGRVSAILELGAGFDPEQKGVDNIVLGGLCLGLSRADLGKKLDWIINFSELRSFIEQPLKTYSTGMRARLAFAVAAAMDPEILIIDEALSVGDLRFQKKCFTYIEEIKRRGKTILFASHDPATVLALADRALVLEQGRLIMDGDPGTAMKRYQQLLFQDEIAAAQVGVSNDGEMLSSANDTNRAVSETNSSGAEITVAAIRTSAAADESTHAAEMTGSPAADRITITTEPEQQLARHAHASRIAAVPRSSETLMGRQVGCSATDASPSVVLPEELRYGQGEVRITDARLVNAAGQNTRAIATAEPFTIQLDIAANKDVGCFYLGFRITTALGQDIYGTSTHLFGNDFSMSEGQRGVASIRCQGHLAPGIYFLTVSLARDHNFMFDRRVDVLNFRVLGNINAYYSSVVNLNAEIAVVI